MKTTKEKMAIISVAFKTGLTILKFVAYFFTGSIVIIAEAWHSFSDILTSLLVYLSVKNKRPPEEASRQEQDPQKIAVNNKWIGILSVVHPEYITSLLIGVFLFFVSIGILRKAMIFISSEISNAFIVGIIFIIFSFCSYIIYKIEISVGRKENSAALISDGMHSRADMISSLLAGFCLIIYTMGINLDRPIAFFIALFILFSSIEIVVNVIGGIRAANGKNTMHSFRYRAFDIIEFILKQDTWMRFADYLDKRFVFGVWKFNFFKTAIRHFKSFFIIIAFCLYSLTCFYIIHPSQLGILERWGKPINSNHPIKPGIHVKFPLPIDKVIKVDAKIVRKLNIGNTTDKNTFALLWTKKHGTEEAFLSGDNNFFYPYFVAHYKVKDIFKFTYNYKDPNELLDNVAHRVISELFVEESFNRIVTTHRKRLEFKAFQSIQRELDSLDSGIELVDLNMKDIHPPIFIADSFEDVIAAYQDKQKMINEAISYRNSSIPKARAEAESEIKKAESYVVDLVNHAQGEGARFTRQLKSYSINKEVTLAKAYLECMRLGLQNNRKIIIDSDAGTPEIWLDFDTLLPLSTKEKMY